MEIFAGAIGALDEYSILMQVCGTLSISFKLEQLKLPLSFMHVHE